MDGTTYGHIAMRLFVSDLGPDGKIETVILSAFKVKLSRKS